ncbi:MAG TPA: mannose-1-phosphate guanylyltransferase/mannose-6-phosphate isomerase [Thermodesulfobacteriota bacterium]|nr:mannose-1-phosphate guanylyltransferase/mannose-6-phosphate isomerase [Thermodesulfobacteriota bacterium]
MTQGLNDPKKLFAIILAGGSGTRFWPLSRETCPKQMLQIVGEDTLLRQTIKRIQDFVPPKNIWIVTTEDKAEDIRFHLDPLGPVAKEIQFISEPLGRNTAPAIGLAAVYLHQLSPESVMMVMPSDHAIPDRERFLGDLRLAIQGASEDHLVTFGIKPTRPETGYGYIKVKKHLKEELSGILKVDRFLEKPDVQRAKSFLSKQGYFWNSGIFVWKTSKLLSELQKHLPSLYETLEEVESLLFVRGDPGKESQSNKPIKPEKQDQRSALCALQYAKLEPISIDYGVMERSKDVWMVPATFRWSDLGSWAALDEIVERDQAGNILRGNSVDIESQNSIIFSDKRLVATIGLKDMVVVDTADATLVTPKERTQEVRKIVEALKQNAREEHLIHRTVERPWGSYTVLEKGEGYKIKRVVLKPEARLSLQRHRRRSEHWVVVTGVARVTRENEDYLVHSNESTFIPINTKHRLENSGKELLQIIEVQSGDYLEEDDIERFEDDYGRSLK